MPDYLNQKAIPVGQTTVSVPIQQSNSTYVWEMEQITVTYSKVSDNPQITITKNGVAYAPTALTVPGPTGRSQTFAQLPYLYIKSSDDVEIVITNGTAGSEVTVFGQYREYLETDPQMYGR